MTGSVADLHPGEWSPTMKASKSSSIRTYTTHNTAVCFSGQWLWWHIVVVKVSSPLLEADFLCTNNLLVNMKNQLLVNAETFYLVLWWHSNNGLSRLSSTWSAADTFSHLLAKYPCLTQPTLMSVTAKHGVDHIVTMGPLVHTQAQCLIASKLSIAKPQFQALEHLSIDQHSNSTWASPLHMVF